MCKILQCGCEQFGAAVSSPELLSGFCTISREKNKTVHDQGPGHPNIVSHYSPLVQGQLQTTCSLPYLTTARETKGTAVYSNSEKEVILDTIERSGNTLQQYCLNHVTLNRHGATRTKLKCYTAFGLS